VRSLDAVIARTFTLGHEFDMLPDDTEETLVGSSLHQAAIVALYTDQELGLDGYIPWEPDEFGRWPSATLGISFQPEGTQLRVFDQDGAPVPLAKELASQKSRLEQRVTDPQWAELDEELRRLRSG